MTAEFVAPSGAGDLSSIGSQLANVLPAGAIEEHAEVGDRCTYRVGGRMRWFVTVGSVDELIGVARVLASADVVDRAVVIGNGSNLLVADGDHDLVGIRLDSDFETVTELADGLNVGAAAMLPKVARRSVALGWSGFEWAVGVPGSIGGAVRMNAGGHGSDMAASIVTADVVDLATATTSTLNAAQLDFGYRRSSVRSDQVVTSARLLLTRCDDIDLGEQELSSIVSWRRQNQPGGANAGSVFTNPDNDSAGRLIDECGLKGTRVGSAEVSPKHANFIQVDAGGSANDVAALIVLVRREVAQRFGVTLHPENQFVGFAPATGIDLTGPIDLSPDSAGANNHQGDQR